MNIHIIMFLKKMSKTAESIKKVSLMYYVTGPLAQ